MRDIRRFRMAPVRLRFPHGSSMERFKRFRFGFGRFLLGKDLSVFQHRFTRNVRFGSRFLKKVLAVPVLRSVPGGTVPMVLVSSSGSVPVPPYRLIGESLVS